MHANKIYAWVFGSFDGLRVHFWPNQIARGSL